MQLSIVESIRTNNFNDSEILKKMQTLWSNSIPKIKNSGYKEIIYGIYYEYDSNYQGDYTLSVMIEDEEGSINLSEDNYKIFIVDKPDGEGIFLTWQKIWKLEEGKINRAYTYDFEKYDPSGEVKIYIKEK